jgi:hypothetical protein
VGLGHNAARAGDEVSISIWLTRYDRSFPLVFLVSFIAVSPLQDLANGSQRDPTMTINFVN